MLGLTVDAGAAPMPEVGLVTFARGFNRRTARVCQDRLAETWRPAATPVIRSLARLFLARHPETWRRLECHEPARARIAW